MTRKIATRSFLVALVGIVSIGATACGSSSSSKGAAPNDNGSVASTTKAPASNGGGSDNGGGSGSGDFCDTIKQDQAALNGSALNSAGTPAQLKAVYADVVPKLEDAESKAPSAIKEDVATVVDAVKALVTQFDKVDYDISKLSPAALASLGNTKIEAASQKVAAYLSTNCGITPST